MYSRHVQVGTPPIPPQIMSAKSSELNIVVPGATEDDEYSEHAIPEQVRCRIRERIRE